MKYVVKRNGAIVSFDKEKISNAIEKASNDVEHGMTSSQIKDCVVDVIAKCREIEGDLSVEVIQDIVEKAIMAYNQDAAKAYIRYRYKREIARDYKTDFFKEVSKKLEAKNVENQNANMDEHSFGGRIGEASHYMMKEYALNFCMSKKSKQNHLDNTVYIHDLDAYAVGMPNCCARETKFVTKDSGVRSFQEYKHGDKVCVLSHDGTFHNATVRSYGVQKLNRITFSYSDNKYTTQRFTANHRWILHNGMETTTLRVGDKLCLPPVQINQFDWNGATEKEKDYWRSAYALIGGVQTNEWIHGEPTYGEVLTILRFHGEKMKEYQQRFDDWNPTKRWCENGDLILAFPSIKCPLLTVKEMTREEKLAYMDGLYSIVGKSQGLSKQITVDNEKLASFIEDEAPSLGYFIVRINDKTGEYTGYETRGFAKEYSFVNDLGNYHWIVQKIEEDKEEEVWCLEVEDTHSFVLPNGITTGNCLSVPFDDLLSKGFNTRQVDIRPANSINTALQLVAVIFQLQSLQQFGGASATHLDWTLVPYLKKSFFKHYKDGLDFIDKNGTMQDLNDSLSIEDKRYKRNKKVYQYAYKMTKKELYQAVEGLYHNLNSLQSRSGNQLPFTSINYGTCTLPEGRMIIHALLVGSINGVGKFHRTSIFPCGIFQVGEVINKRPGDPNYDLFKLALKSTAQRLYPNYANVDWTGNTGYDKNDPRTYFSTINHTVALHSNMYRKLI